MSKVESPYIKTGSAHLEKTKSLLDLNEQELRAVRNAWLEKPPKDMREDRTSSVNLMADSKSGRPLLHEGVYRMVCKSAYLITNKRSKNFYISTVFETVEPQYLLQRTWHKFFLAPTETITMPPAWLNKNILLLQDFLRVNKKDPYLLENEKLLIGLKALVYVKLIRRPIYDDENKIVAFLDNDLSDDQIKEVINKARASDTDVQDHEHEEKAAL